MNFAYQGKFYKILSQIEDVLFAEKNNFLSFRWQHI